MRLTGPHKEVGGLFPGFHMLVFRASPDWLHRDELCLREFCRIPTAESDLQLSLSFFWKANPPSTGSRTHPWMRLYQDRMGLDVIKPHGHSSLSPAQEKFQTSTGCLAKDLGTSKTG